jgi:uncharacterized tellurite resistance protein B-like protein
MRQILSILFGGEPAPAEQVPGLAPEQVAVAVLMVEAARLDGHFEAAERERVQDLLARRFGLTPWVAAELVARAERTATESVAWQGFTQTIKEAMDEQERVGVLELLWEVAYADGALHDYEASLLRRVAGLLYVGDRANGEARLRVMTKLGIAR